MAKRRGRQWIFQITLSEKKDEMNRIWVPLKAEYVDGIQESFIWRETGRKYLVVRDELAAIKKAAEARGITDVLKFLQSEKEEAKV